MQVFTCKSAADLGYSNSFKSPMISEVDSCLIVWSPELTVPHLITVFIDLVG